MITGHKNVRILISLLKQYDIRYAVISPGSRCLALIKSIQDDPFFKCYSVIDERSAAYYAVGLTLELRRPVMLISTSGQATRNYIPGLSEAYYRKAPVLAIIGDYDARHTGQMVMQCFDQLVYPRDSLRVLADVPIVKDHHDEVLVTRRINEALDALTRGGGGPALINLRVDEFWLPGNEQLEVARKIERHTLRSSEWPRIGDRRTLVVVGQHQPFDGAELQAIERFASKFNCAFYVNHISNYNGPRSVHGNAVLATRRNEAALIPDLVITIGGQHGDYPVDGFLRRSKVEHWRVDIDGFYGDTYGSLTHIFECSDREFFERACEQCPDATPTDSYYRLWKDTLAELKWPDTYPVSHMLLAGLMHERLPPGSIIHFGILHSLRVWELFPLPEGVRCYSNVAGFGIDGVLSTFLGHSLATDNLCILFIGDLSFFYDMNAIGNRHLRNNIRIVLVNNGGGAEFRLNTHTANKFGDSADLYIAGAGHFGKSAEGWAVNNGFHYLGVRSREEITPAIDRVLAPSDRPVLVELFTTLRDEARAIASFLELNQPPQAAGNALLRVVKDHIPPGVKSVIRKILK